MRNALLFLVVLGGGCIGHWNPTHEGMLYTASEEIECPRKALTYTETTEHFRVKGCGKIAWCERTNFGREWLCEERVPKTPLTAAND